MKRTNWQFYIGWTICILFCLLFWSVVAGVIRHEVWLRRLEARGSVQVTEEHTWNLDIKIPSFIYNLDELDNVTGVHLKGVLIDSTVQLTIGMEDLAEERE